jgi:pentatricopeptide repeat protein
MIWQPPWKHIKKHWTRTLALKPNRFTIYSTCVMDCNTNELTLEHPSPNIQRVMKKKEQVVKVRAVDATTRQQHAFCIKRRMDELQLPLNETAYTALVRLLSKAQLVDEAESLLKEAETIQQCKPRLRLYSSLLCAYCEVGRMESALKLWVRLSNKNLVLTEREYAALIQCSIQTGDAILWNESCRIWQKTCWYPVAIRRD